uniref:Uncharacterized protein n=1 Tax=Rhizophora mucronata TaxID=61149 RepID=A0A2P2MX57_RHIMU
MPQCHDNHFYFSHLLGPSQASSFSILFKEIFEQPSPLF